MDKILHMPMCMCEHECRIVLPLVSVFTSPQRCRRLREALFFNGRLLHGPRAAQCIVTGVGGAIALRKMLYRGVTGLEPSSFSFSVSLRASL